jgi:D-serine deaminase-like pyridoxal phosphate-dependent protein
VTRPDVGIGRAAERAERIDARFKGLAPSTFGLSLDELAAARPRLFDGAFTPPIMVLREEALRHNIETMARYARASGVEHAPHGKTTLAPRIFDLQLEAGAWGLSVGTASQVVLCRAFGFSRVFLANELVDPAAIEWILRELRADPGFEFLAYLDSLDGVRLFADRLPTARPRGGLRGLGLLVEMGPTGGRTGCRSVEEAVEVGRAAAAAGLPVAGVAGYEGGLGSVIDAAVLGRVRAFLGLMRDAAEALLAGGLVGDPGRPILSAGGSVFFDEVVAAFHAPLRGGTTPRTIIRPGAYVSHDAGHYEGLSPFSRPEGIAGFTLQPALEAWGQLVSVPEAGLAIATVGRRDVSFDLGMPIPLRLRRPATGEWQDASGMTVTGLNDQHAFVRVPEDVDARVGDWIAFGISHPCTAFDKWHLLPVVDADHHVVDVVRTYF